MIPNVRDLDSWPGMAVCAARMHHFNVARDLGCADLVVRIKTFGVGRWRWAPRVVAQAVSLASACEEDVARALAVKLPPEWFWFVAPWNADGRPSALAIRHCGRN